jgi:hypothetical protein
VVRTSWWTVGPEYRAEPIHPCCAAGRGLTDGVIDPADTRAVLNRSPAVLRTEHAGLPTRQRSAMNEQTIHRTPHAPLSGSAAGPEPPPGDN